MKYIISSCFSPSGSVFLKQFPIFKIISDKNWQNSVLCIREIHTKINHSHLLNKKNLTAGCYKFLNEDMPVV